MSDPRPVGDMRAVQKGLNCCRTSIYKLMREDPEFPAPFSILGKLTWFVDEIEAYKETRPRREYVAADARARVAAKAAERDDVDADGNDAEGEDDDGDADDAEAA